MITQAPTPTKGKSSAVRFSVTAEAAWAPGAQDYETWQKWAHGGFSISTGPSPKLLSMPAMQRRRVGPLGRMALEVAFECLGDRADVPTVFCSAHGEVSRSVELLSALAADEPLSPASFGLSVHNAAAGMLSIARHDKANNIALSARRDTVEHGVIEACGLLADGEAAVLLVVYDSPLPAIYADFRDGDEQAFAWAWLIEAPQQEFLSLAWSTIVDADAASTQTMAPGLEVLRFQLRKDARLDRLCGKRKWQWSRNA